MVDQKRLSKMFNLYKAKETLAMFATSVQKIFEEQQCHISPPDPNDLLNESSGGDALSKFYCTLIIFFQCCNKHSKNTSYVFNAAALDVVNEFRKVTVELIFVDTFVQKEEEYKSKLTRRASRGNSFISPQKALVTDASPVQLGN